MSHNLALTTDGRAMMAANHDTRVPWHGLGTPLHGLVDAESMLTAAHLNWDVELRSIDTWDHQGENLPIDSHKAVIRPDTDTIFAVVSNKYVPITNRQAFEAFDEIFGEGLALYESAGALWDGRIVWALAEIPGFITLPGNDHLQRYLLLYTSHDGSAAVRVKLVNERVECHNTLNVALREVGKEIRIPHNALATSRIKKARESFGFAMKHEAELVQIFERLSEQHWTDPKKYFNAVLPEARSPEEASRNIETVDTLQRILETSPTLDHISSTYWGALNAVTEYVDHHKAYRGEEGKLRSVWFGAGERLKQRAFDVAAQLLERNN